MRNQLKHQPVRVGQRQRLLTGAGHDSTDIGGETFQMRMPPSGRALRDRKRHRGRLPSPTSTLRRSRPGEECDQRARLAGLVAVVQVVGAGVVEVDHRLHQPQAQHGVVKVRVGLRFSGDRGHMVQPGRRTWHDARPPSSRRTGLSSIPPDDPSWSTMLTAFSVRRDVARLDGSRPAVYPRGAGDNERMPGLDEIASGACHARPAAELVV
jgi:hypothetical protein